MDTIGEHNDNQQLRLGLCLYQRQLLDLYRFRPPKSLVDPEAFEVSEPKRHEESQRMTDKNERRNKQSIANARMVWGKDESMKGHCCNEEFVLRNGSLS